MPNLGPSGILPASYLRQIPWRGEREITVYRAVPKGVTEIRPGDWVALTQRYAAGHDRGGRVLSKRVPASEVYWAGTDLNEWFWTPIQKTGSRAARVPDETVGLVVGETDQSLPAILIVDLPKLHACQTLAELRACGTAVLGYIGLQYPKGYNDEGFATCEDKEDRTPLQVSWAAAEPGWGPLTYDAALWIAADNADVSTNGFLMPDRNNVFWGARRVWKHYLEHRKADVTSRKIPAMCTHHGERRDPDPVLDRMYRARPKGPGFRPMLGLYRRGSDLVETLAERMHQYEECIRAELVKLGEALFARRIGT